MLGTKNLILTLLYFTTIIDGNKPVYTIKYEHLHLVTYEYIFTLILYLHLLFEK